MKRLVIPFVIAMIVGIGLASAATLLRAKPAPVVADTSVHAAVDSTKERVIEPVEHAGAPGAPRTAAADSASRHTDSPTHAASAPAPAPANAVVAPAAPTAPTAASLLPAPNTPANAAATSPEKAGSERRIARVIASMPPRDAAKVLAQLTDHDIVIIIGNLTEKQEAAILAQLPADRLATVSKLALRPLSVVK